MLNETDQALYDMLISMITAAYRNQKLELVSSLELSIQSLIKEKPKSLAEISNSLYYQPSPSIKGLNRLIYDMLWQPEKIEDTIVATHASTSNNVISIISSINEEDILSVDVDAVPMVIEGLHRLNDFLKFVFDVELSDKAIDFIAFSSEVTKEDINIFIKDTALEYVQNLHDVLNDIIIDPLITSDYRIKSENGTTNIVQYYGEGDALRLHESRLLYVRNVKKFCNDLRDLLSQELDITKKSVLNYEQALQFKTENIHYEDIGLPDNEEITGIKIIELRSEINKFLKNVSRYKNIKLFKVDGFTYEIRVNLLSDVPPTANTITQPVTEKDKYTLSKEEELQIRLKLIAYLRVQIANALFQEPATIYDDSFIISLFSGKGHYSTKGIKMLLTPDVLNLFADEEMLPRSISYIIQHYWEIDDIVVEHDSLTEGKLHVQFVTKPLKQTSSLTHF